jgi:outer membrane protein OmpA-like peptidoglycan-associated protein
MARRGWIVFAVLVLVVMLMAGCSTRANQAKQMADLRGQLAEIDTQGAKTCAPREFASAEAHLEIAQEEWEERDFIRAQDHLTFATASISSARKWLSNCVDTTPPDRDGDGVLDPDDACPDTPGLPELQGCPDSDGDGVGDNVDKCPEVPGPPENEGCPNDKDGDGITDDKDDCPDQWGTKENNGCPKFIEVQGDKIVLKQQIHFQTGRSNIEPGSYGILDEIAAVLKQSPKWVVRVEGHTDTVGRHASNMKLSQARAESCMSYLIQQGAGSQQLTAVGYGPDKPVASNNTAVGRAQNRRTEFKIISK